MIKIPNNKTFAIPQNSNVLGNLFTGRNLDLTENEGRIRAGRKLITTTDTANATPAVGFKYFNNGTGSKWYTVISVGATGYVYQGTANISGTFAGLGGGVPTALDATLGDIEVAFSKLWVSGNDGKIYNYNNSATWANITAGSSSTTYTTMLQYFPYMDRMYVSKNGNQIQSFNSSETVISPGSTYALQLPADDIITCMRASNNRLWICTMNSKGKNANVYEWDGSSTTVNKNYKLDTNGALACVIKDDIPYIMDSLGNILVWNGGTFVKKTGLTRLTNKALYDNASLINTRFIHPNGMSIINGRIHVLIDGTYFDAASHAGTMDVTIPSGVYEYDENKGLIHKHSFTMSTDGLDDFGQIRIAGVGGLSGDFFYSGAVISTNGTFLVSAKINTSNTTTQFVIAFDDNNDTVQKSLSLITPKIDSQGVTDTWQKAYLKFTELPSGDKVALKYRTYEDTPIEINITWASTTSFTTTTDITAYVGAEAEILQGLCAGQCSHITSVDNTNGTYTVTLDETHAGVTTETGKARLAKWTKLSSTATEGNFKEFTIGKPATWIQFKVFGLLTGKTEIEELQVINDTFKPSK